jgi:uncharacterized spore protein YtfJ
MCTQGELEMPNDQSPANTGESHESTTFVERLAAKLGTNAHATTVYGAPVEREGITVIPVARVRYGFGGGSGREKEGKEGSGGGGGVYAAPVGYIELKDNSSEYRPIRDPTAMVPMIAVAGVLGLLALRGLTKLIRR